MALVVGQRTDQPGRDHPSILIHHPDMVQRVLSSNHFNYARPEYDEMYERIRTMPPGPERTAIYEQMRDMVIEDSPYCGSMARIRRYLIHPWLSNFKPTEDFYNWVKYLDIEESK